MAINSEDGLANTAAELVGTNRGSEGVGKWNDFRDVHKSCLKLIGRAIEVAYSRGDNENMFTLKV